jgi:hypothetical protein
MRKFAYRCLSVMFLLCICSSCMPALRVTRFTQYPAKPPNHEIKIYRTTLPDRRFEEIGIVSSRQINRFIEMEQVLESMREAAREMGGDAIIGLTEVNEAQGFVRGDIERDPVLSGTVIRFLKEE